MRSSVILSTLSSIALVSAQATPAKVVTNNPKGASFVATLPATAKVQGSVTVSSAPEGKGVVYDFKLSGLPTTGTPFMYHVHAKPVPSDGNCTGAGAHLDPYQRGESPPCSESAKETCQVGDLSGKYGNITAGPTFNKPITDIYSSLVKGDPQYVGDLSIVIHLTDKTRIGCANFTAVTK